MILLSFVNVMICLGIVCVVLAVSSLFFSLSSTEVYWHSICGRYLDCFCITLRLVFFAVSVMQSAFITTTIVLSRCYQTEHF